MYKHITIAVALDAEAPERAFEAVKALADADTKISVLHVREEVPSYATAYIPDDYVKMQKVEFQKLLDDLAARFEGAKGVLIEGHSARTIVDWCESNGVDCIVLTSHQPGVQDYLLGSTAGRVVRHAHCSVHVVR